MAQAMRWDDVGAFGDSRVTLRRQGFRGSFPTSPAQMELPGGILEEPNGRVPASAPLFSPHLRASPPWPLVFGSCQSGTNMVLGPVWPNTDLQTEISRASSLASPATSSQATDRMLSCSRRFYRVYGRTDGLDVCQASRPHPPKSEEERERQCRSGASAAAARELGDITPWERPQRPVLCPPASIRIRSAPPEMPLSTPRVEALRGDCRPDGRPVVTG